jgi:hypothetical protein
MGNSSGGGREFSTLFENLLYRPGSGEKGEGEKREEGKKTEIKQTKKKREYIFSGRVRVSA